MTRVTFLVTHLHGTGHLTRMLLLAAACRAAGLSARVISGGMPLAHLDTFGVDILQLPPVRSDGATFVRLLDRNGSAVSQALLAERRRLIAEALQSSPPDVFITELFPFGRRLLSAEFEAALRTATSLPRPPLILSSIRDILEPPSRAQKAVAAETRLAESYHGVLVHSDPRLASLGASWPVSTDVAQMLHYTGYVAAPQADANRVSGEGEGEILVTAGGGPLGGRLFEIATKAARETGRRRWRLLVGGSHAAELCAKLNRVAAEAAVIAEPVRPDYREMLANCAAAVGRCGYNTALDWLQAGVPGVLVPFAEAAEKEQILRAKLLHRHYGYGFVVEDETTPAKLAEAVEAAIARGRVEIGDLDLDGAAGSVRIVSDLLKRYR